MKILGTERLQLRELDPDNDAAFLLELLNTPKFVEYIGDRGVRTVEQAVIFGREKYCEGYRKYGYGLYTVELKAAGSDITTTAIGICGFVRRGARPAPGRGGAGRPGGGRRGDG